MSCSFTNTWDTADRKTQGADSKGVTKQYVYDNADRLTQVKYSDSASELRFDFTYSNRNEVTQIDRYTDVAATTKVSLSQYAYDDAGKVTSITHKNGAGTSTIDSFNYTWDNANRITQETSTLGPTKNYTLDANGQVTGDGTDTFSFDANGNRNMSGYTVTTANRTSTDGTWNYSYDDEGSMTSRTKISTGEYWTYAFDNDNRLVDVKKYSSSGGTLLLEAKEVYDALGNHIEKDVDANGDGTFESVTKFAYDGPNAWADLDNSLNVQTRRIYTDAIDALFARIGSSGNEDWYLNDNIGSVRDIVDSSGTAIDHLDYSTFGTPTESSPSNGDRYKFTSREWEAEFGIQYSRARYLQNGRWMEEDPLGFAAGDTNLTRDVGNVPQAFADPTGAFAAVAGDRADNGGDAFVHRLGSRDDSPGLQEQIRQDAQMIGRYVESFNPANTQAVIQLNRNLRDFNDRFSREANRALASRRATVEQASAQWARITANITPRATVNILAGLSGMVFCALGVASQNPVAPIGFLASFNLLREGLLEIAAGHPVQVPPVFAAMGEEEARVLDQLAFLAGGPRPPMLVVGAASGGIGRLTGFTQAERHMIANAERALRDTGYDTSLIGELIRADMPAGYRGMSLPGGAALGEEASLLKQC